MRVNKVQVARVYATTTLAARRPSTARAVDMSAIAMSTAPGIFAIEPIYNLLYLDPRLHHASQCARPRALEAKS